VNEGIELMGEFRDSEQEVKKNLEVQHAERMDVPLGCIDTDRTSGVGSGVQGRWRRRCSRM
jgi:hypothetical protein